MIRIHIRDLTVSEVLRQSRILNHEHPAFLLQAATNAARLHALDALVDGTPAAELVRHRGRFSSSNRLLDGRTAMRAALCPRSLKTLMLDPFSVGAVIASCTLGNRRSTTIPVSDKHFSMMTCRHHCAANGASSHQKSQPRTWSSTPGWRSKSCYSITSRRRIRTTTISSWTHQCVVPSAMSIRDGCARPDD